MERKGTQLLVRLLCESGQSLLLLEERLTAVQPSALESFGLTRREAEVLAWAAEGKTNAEIGSILGTSPRTVAKHLEHVYLSEARRRDADCGGEARLHRTSGGLLSHRTLETLNEMAGESGRSDVDREEIVKARNQAFCEFNLCRDGRSGRHRDPFGRQLRGHAEGALSGGDVEVPEIRPTGAAAAARLPALGTTQ